MDKNINQWRISKWRLTIPIPVNLETMIKEEAKEKGLTYTAVILNRLALGYQNDSAYIAHVNEQLATAQIEDGNEV